MCCAIGWSWRPRSPSWLLIAGCILSLGRGARVAHAQSIATDTGAFHWPPRIALPSDTGRMMLGRVDFSTYTTPGVCVQAVAGVLATARRSGGEDTMPYADRIAATPPQSVLDAGRACAARFRIAELDTVDLHDALVLMLAIDDTAAARAVLRRRLALARAAVDSARVLRDASDVYLDARPSHPSDAVRFLSTLDSLRGAPSLERADAHMRMLRHVTQLFDTVAMRRELEIVLAIAATLPASARANDALAIHDVMVRRVMLALYETPAQVPALIDSAVHAGYPFFWDVLRMKAALIGTPARALATTFWYPLAGAAAPIAKDNVTLLVQVQSDAFGANARDAMLRRLATQYGPSGLRITLVTQTHGYTEIGRTLSPPQTPAQEAAAAQWYYQRHRAIPASLVVEETSVTRQPDGRRAEVLTPFRDDYKLSPTVIVDRHGVIRCLSPMMVPLSEAELRACIERALRS